MSIIASPANAKTGLETKNIALSNAQTLNELTGYAKFNDWMRYFAQNLPRMWKEPDVCDLPKIGASAIVIGGGPSLEKYEHLKLLAQSGYTGTIVCCDKVLRAALQANVRPHYVINVDSSELCLPFIENVDTSMNLILCATSHPKFRAMWKGATYWFVPDIGFCDHKFGVPHVLSEISGKTIISTGGNAGSTAVLVTYMMNARPTGLLGMDMSYDATTPIEETTYWQSLHETVGEQARGFYARRTNPYWKNEYVIDHVFDAYRELFLERTRLLNIDVVNCSGQGSLHGGNVRCMDFVEFLEKYG